MKKEPKILLSHIRECIEAIEEYTKDVDKEMFMVDDEKQDAIVRRLEIIGEATTNLEKQFKQDYPDVPWQDISDMRNRLVHQYFEVDLNLVWQVVQKDIPELKENILKIEKSE